MLNSVELGSGSIRIHREELLARMFDLVWITPEQARDRFCFLLDAFQYAAPPHGGIALDLDQAIMMLAGQETIREVIAFPKTQSAADLMTGAPSRLDPCRARRSTNRVETPPRVMLLSTWLPP